MSDNIKELKQLLLDHKLSEDFVKRLPPTELEWLVSKGYDTVEALQAATFDVLSGVAEGRARAICCAFAGTIDAYTYLKQGFDPIHFLGTSNNSTLASAGRSPKAVYTWELPLQQLEDKLSHLRGLQVEPSGLGVRQGRLDEEGCRDDFCIRALSPVNVVLRAAGSNVEYHKPGTSTPLNGKPDYSANETVDDKPGAVKVAAESKTPYVLRNVSNDLIGSRHVGNLRKAINQVYGYVWDAGSVESEPVAGFLTDTNRTWFFLVDRSDEAMFITEAILCHSEAPSVRQMLYLLLQLRVGPLPPRTEREKWSQAAYDKIFARDVQQQQGQPGSPGTGQPSSSQQGPVTSSQSKGGSSRPAAEAPANPTITPVEDFKEMLPIGHGETGVVSAAWLHGRRVAVKFGDCYNSKDIVRRLMNEVAMYKALKLLQGIVIPWLEASGYTMWGGSFYVATQLIKGHTHQEGSEVPMAQRRAAEQALAAIHDAGYLHGDVRGDNLIFEEGTGKAFFIDLGMSKACSCSEDFQVEMQELRALLTQSPTSVHSWPHS